MRWLAVAALLCTAFSGCLAETFEPQEADPNVPVPPSGPSGSPGSGSASEHGDPDIQEGQVTVQEPSLTGPAHWTASKTVTIDNDFGGAIRSDVDIAFGPGDMQVVPSPDGDYHYTMTLIGQGGTEEEAREALSEIEWGHTDTLDGDTLRLDTWADRDGASGISCTTILIISECTGKSWSVDMTAALPTSPAHDLDLDHGSADVEVTGLHGSALAVDVGSGDVSLDGLAFGQIRVGTGSGDIEADDIDASSISADSGSGDHDWNGIRAGSVVLGAGSGDLSFTGLADRLDAETGSGDHDLDVTGSDVGAHSGSGDIDLDFTPDASGSIDIDTGSGDVDVALASSAYDITVRTGSGDIDVDVSDTERVDGGNDDSFAHYRTPGFPGAAPATAIGVDTGSGDVTIDG